MVFFVLSNNYSCVNSSFPMNTLYCSLVLNASGNPLMMCSPECMMTSLTAAKTHQSSNIILYMYSA